MSGIDDLLEQALATGAIPAEATAEERAELGQLLAVARETRSMQARVDAEAGASMPVARARFERFVAGHQAAARPAVAPVRATRRGLVARMFDGHRRLALSGAAVAIGLLAVVGLFGGQALLSSTETASAQVLFPEDYVQLQGIVEGVSVSGDTRTVRLDSPAGVIDVALNAETSVVDDQSTIDPASLAKGDQIFVGGVATNGHALAAQTVALFKTKTTSAPPRPKVLSKLAASLEGRVSLLTISKDGATARVAIDALNGERYVIKVDVATAEELLRLSSTALGAHVRANAPADPKAAARLAVTSPVPVSPVPERTVTPEAPSSSPASGTAVRPDAASASGKPSFVTVRGVVLSRNGNVLQMETLRGPVTVVVRATTRRLAGESGLTLVQLGNPDAMIGHTVTVTGGLDAKTGRVIADLIVVGPRFR